MMRPLLVAAIRLYLEKSRTCTPAPRICPEQIDRAVYGRSRVSGCNRHDVGHVHRLRSCGVRLLAHGCFFDCSAPLDGFV